jgi:pimeloyl-ACP methyl ester carboxylesterase
MKIARVFIAIAAALTATLGEPARAQQTPPVEARNVVLVHGAWADGSSWAEVIPLLQAAGLKVTAVQNPLTSLADSDAAARRELALQDGPTVLVAGPHRHQRRRHRPEGHRPRLCRRAGPRRRRGFRRAFREIPGGAGARGRPGARWFHQISEEAFLSSFANGVVHKKAEVLYAVQEPAAASLFGERTTAAAWHSKPSWYAVSKLDQTINPDLERFLAKRMNATTVEVEAGHLSLVSHPKAIADLILAAAGRKK